MIALNHIYKHFDKQSVLEDISLHFDPGTRWCIVGGSGSGKSVLLKLILGLMEPDAGQIIIDGQSTQAFNSQDWQEVMADFGVVFQSSALFDSLNVRENIGLRLYEHRSMLASEIQKQVLAALAEVNLEAEVLEKYPAELSGGMRKRVAIARALIHRPRYLVYDEPTTGLDPVSASIIDNLIGQLATQADRMTLLVTHDMVSVRQLATHVAMLHEKRLLFAGETEAFFGSADPEIQAFLSRVRRAEPL